MGEEVGKWTLSDMVGGNIHGCDFWTIQYICHDVKMLISFNPASFLSGFPLCPRAQVYMNKKVHTALLVKANEHRPWERLSERALAKEMLIYPDNGIPHGYLNPQKGVGSNVVPSTNTQNIVGLVGDKQTAEQYIYNINVQNSVSII